MTEAGVGDPKLVLAYGCSPPKAPHGPSGVPQGRNGNLWVILVLQASLALSPFSGFCFRLPSPLPPGEDYPCCSQAVMEAGRKWFSSACDHQVLGVVKSWFPWREESRLYYLKVGS